MTKEEILKTYYGYDAFRPGQEAMIDALLAGRDALAIMPTGAGKSVCYQVPALLLPEFLTSENISLSIRNWMRISTILKMRRIHLFRTVP